MQWDDTAAQFTISNREQVQPAPNEIETCHSTLLLSRKSRTPRQFMPDSEWISGLESHLNRLIDSRVDHVQYWMDSNLERFESGHTAIVDIRRRFDSLVIEMKTNFQLCGAQCASCRLFCVRRRLHTSKHSCQTAHKCVRECEVCEGPTHRCGLLYVSCSVIYYQLTMLQCRASREARVRRAGFLMFRLLISVQLCYQPVRRPLPAVGEARLSRRLHEGRQGRLFELKLSQYQVLRHGGDHLCSALVHLCEKVLSVCSEGILAHDHVSSAMRPQGHKITRRENDLLSV